MTTPTYIPPPQSPAPLTPGYSTTEFIASAGLAVAAVVAAVADPQLGSVAQDVFIAVAGAVVVGYTGFRSWLKAKHAQVAAHIAVVTAPVPTSAG